MPATISSACLFSTSCSGSTFTLRTSVAATESVDAEDALLPPPPPPPRFGSINWLSFVACVCSEPSSSDMFPIRRNLLTSSRALFTLREAASCDDAESLALLIYIPTPTKDAAAIIRIIATTRTISTNVKAFLFTLIFLIFPTLSILFFYTIFYHDFLLF